VNARRTKLILSLLVAIGAAWPAAAAADPATPAEASRAEALFQEGKRLMEQGQLAKACEVLAASDALDPTVSTLGLLAGCHEEQGRIASAWKEYRATAERAQAANDDRAAFALSRAAQLEPRVPKLLIRTKQRTASIAVFRNRQRVAPDEIGVEVAVDPGAYEIVARAPKMQEHRVTVTVKESARVVVDVPDLVPIGAARPAARAPLKPAPPPSAAPAAPAGEDGLRPAQVGALIAGGVGLAGAGVGIAFGAMALSKNDESAAIHDLCTTAETCARGRELREGAFQDATIATIGFGAFGAGLATALVLVLLPNDKPAAAVAPVVGAHSGGAMVFGNF
jgi:hypothetical protein